LIRRWAWWFEFCNGSDHVQRSLPSEPELQAYRLAQRIGSKPG
jgi:hypothetical protein